MHPFPRTVGSIGLLATLLAGGLPDALAATVRPDDSPTPYPDRRPAADYRLDAEDTGPVLRHGGGPGRCDELGARDVWVWESGGTYHMHYDGAGPSGWLACLVTSTNLKRVVAPHHWVAVGAPGGPAPGHLPRRERGGADADRREESQEP